MNFIDLQKFPNYISVLFDEGLLDHYEIILLLSCLDYPNNKQLFRSILNLATTHIDMQVREFALKKLIQFMFDRSNYSEAFPYLLKIRNSRNVDLAEIAKNVLGWSSY